MSKSARKIVLGAAQNAVAKQTADTVVVGGNGLFAHFVVFSDHPSAVRFLRIVTIDGWNQDAERYLNELVQVAVNSLGKMVRCLYEYI